MLKIKLLNYTADLDDQQISIVMTSPYPLMATGIGGGNYIYNFTLPATPELKKTFLHAHRPAARANEVKVHFNIDASGIHYAGIATLVEAGDDTYEVMCPVGNGSFNMRSKEVKLPELDFGGDISLPKLPFVAEVKDSIVINKMQNGFFTFVQELSFLSPVSNTAELSADGKTFTANEAKTVSVQLLFNSNINASSNVLSLFKNGIAIKNWYVSTGSQTFIHNVSLALADTLSVSIQLGSIGGQLGGNVNFINGIIFNGTRLTINNTAAQNTMTQGATSRYPDVSFAVFPVENPSVFNNWPDDMFSVDNVNIKVMYRDYFKVINYWHAGEFPAILSVTENAEEYQAGNLFVPFPYIAYLINRITNYFGLRVLNNVFDDELKYAVLLNFFIENTFLTSNPDQLSFNESFNLNDHVPDWTVYDFLQQLNNLFGIGYEVDDVMQTITFTFVKDLIESPSYIDISHLVVEKPRANWSDRIAAFKLMQNYPDNDALKDEIKSLEGLNYKGFVVLLSDLPISGNKVNDYYFVWVSQRYYAWQYNADTYAFGWVFHSRTHVIEISSGNDATEISTNLPAAMSVLAGDHSHTKIWNIPQTHQSGIFEGAPDAYNGKWQPLVVWYHGLKSDTTGGTYPFASADCVDRESNIITDVPHSLKLQGFKNIYDVRWKDFLYWRMQAKPIRVHIIPDKAFLSNFKFSKKVRFGGVSYLVVEARGNINRMGPDVWELSLLVV